MTEKKALFLLPGLLCDQTVWVEQIKVLSDYADITVPCFRGMTSLEEMAESVLDQAPQQFSVVGHSMGGRVALELMYLAENRIEKFCLMDTGVHPLQAGEKQKRQVFLDLALNEGMAAVARGWGTPMVGSHGQLNTELMGSFFAMIESYSPDDFVRQVSALLTRKDRLELLKGIAQKVLLICGAEDAWSPVSQHEFMLEHLQQGTLEIVQESGHMVTMEQPEAVNKILLDWFLT